MMNTNAVYRARRVALDPLAWYLSRRELRERMKETSLEGIVDAVDQYVGRGFYASIHAVQRRSEILELAALVQELEPAVIVEIGTYKGGTLYIWSRANPQARLIVSIDLPSAEYGRGYANCRRRLYREFLYDRPGGRLESLRADSHARATVERLTAILEGRPIDFLYIDGDHTYEGVKQDYEMYGSLVRPGGMIAFHDIETRSRGCEVPKLWGEVKTRHRWREIVHRPDYMGIGILWI